MLILEILAFMLGLTLCFLAHQKPWCWLGMYFERNNDLFFILCQTHTHTHTQTHTDTQTHKTPNKSHKNQTLMQHTQGNKAHNSQGSQANIHCQKHGGRGGGGGIFWKPASHTHNSDKNNTSHFIIIFNVFMHFHRFLLNPQ